MRIINTLDFRIKFGCAGGYKLLMPGFPDRESAVWNLQSIVRMLQSIGLDLIPVTESGTLCILMHS